MPFSATINLGTVGVAITSVKLYGCTGNNGTDCTGCTVLTGYENVGVNTFPLLVSGIPNGVRYIQAEALGACSADAVKQCITVSGIPGPTATPAPTATLANATPGPTSTQTPTPTPTPTQTSGTTPLPTQTLTPTPTQTSQGYCWTLTYDNSLPTDLYVRYRNNETGEVDTTLISNLESMDNGNNTYTTAICVAPGGTYNNPVFVQGGIEVVSQTYLWSMGSTCTSAPVCLMSQPDPTPNPTATASPQASFTTSNINAAWLNSYAGTKTETSGTTITVINGTATVRLKTWVVTGYRADTTLTINGNTYSPTEAGQGMTGGTGEGNSSFLDINLPIGVYNITSWTVSAISDGSMTVAQAKLEQI